MKAIEFDFDSELMNLCQLIQDNMKIKLHPGMVAACIVDPTGNSESKTSIRRGSKWIHAERHAIESYELHHGRVPENSIIIVTLSPCNERKDDTAQHRDGESCTDYLNAKGIKTVYCGYIDPTQDNQQAKFTQIQTKDKTIRHVCKEFAKTFLPIEEDTL